MRARWESRQLGEVVLLDRQQAMHSGLVYVGLEDIEQNTGRFIGLPSPQTVRSTTFRFTNRHVLYGRLRPYLNKVLAPDFEGHCSTEIIPLLPTSAVTREYLFYWLTHSATVQSLSSTSTGARMPRANLDAALRLVVPIPKLDQQRRIVAILDEAFEGIATAKAHAERQRRNAREVFDCQLHDIFANGSSSWSSAPIERYIRFIDYRGRTPEKATKGLRLITAKNVKKGFIQSEPMEFVAEASYDEWMTRGIPKIGDVLFTTEAPLGNVAQLDTEERVVFAQRVIIMQADPAALDSTFLKYLLLSMPVQAKIRAQATGATAQGIKASLLKRIEIRFPSNVAKQRLIASRLDALAEETGRLEQLFDCKLAAIDELKQSLVRQAFSGQL